MSKIIGIRIPEVGEESFAEFPGEREAFQFLSQSMEISRQGTELHEYYFIPSGSTIAGASEFMDNNEPWEVINGER